MSRKYSHTFVERFHKHYEIDPVSGCWLWTARIHDGGYGQIANEWYITESAHRASYRIHYLYIPSGKYVLHRCDVRRCVNPDHLYLGDHRSNMSDMVDKGRQCRAGAHRKGSSSIKISDKEMRKIYKLRLGGMSWYALGKKYGVRQDTIKGRIERMIRRGLLDA